MKKLRTLFINYSKLKHVRQAFDIVTISNYSNKDTLCTVCPILYDFYFLTLYASIPSLNVLSARPPVYCLSFVILVIDLLSQPSFNPNPNLN